MKKIFVGKTETATAVIQQIMNTPDPEVTLVIPRDALLKSSLENFRTIRREAESVQKLVEVESVDEEALALATAAELPCRHPLLHGPAAGPLTSVIDLRRKAAAAPVESHSSHRGKQENSEEDRKIAVFSSNHSSRHFSENSIPAEEKKDRWDGGMPPELQPAEEKKHKKKKSHRILLGLLVLLLLIGAAVYAVTVYMKRGDVALTFQTADWNYGGTVLADKTATKTDIDKNTLPAEVFTQERNLAQQYPASGTQVVSAKAAGRIKVVNAYSSDPQILVKTTRFITQDGKVFRLDNQVTVPGAAIKDGKIISSSTEAGITADQPGAEYNRAQAEKLTIPGFKGTPKYAGFYGEMISTTGGLVGKKPVPTDQDVNSARSKTADILKSSLEAAFEAAKPKGYVVLPDATSIQVIKLNNTKDVDDHGNFTFFGDAILKGVGFKDQIMQDYLSAIALKSTSTLPNVPISLNNLKITYATSTMLDVVRGQIQVSLSAKGILHPVFDRDGFLKQIAGKSVDEVRKIISALPGLTDARISIWPFWSNKMPGDANKIKITVN